MSPPSPSKLKLAFNLSTGADTGGAAIREVEAFRSPAGLVSGWEVRSMVAASNYIEYTQDVPYSMEKLEELYDTAAVVHLNHTLHGHAWYDDGEGKPTVLEHHGLHKGAFDIDFQGAIVQATKTGCVQIGSTANLELFGPITWAPIPYNLVWLQKVRAYAKQAQEARPHHDGHVLTIAHAPTNRAIKSTAAFISALEALVAKGLPVRSLLIENRTHLDCLQLKAQADIFVDQLQLGYGCNAIEAWGMGLPVVGGISDPAWRKHMVARWGSMPLYEATDATLAARLTDMILSRDLRQEFAAKGKEHVELHHSQEGHVKLMCEIYESAKPTRPSDGTGPISRRRYARLSRNERLRLLRSRRAEWLEHQRAVSPTVLPPHQRNP
jgi:hypothetical protein